MTGIRKQTIKLARGEVRGIGVRISRFLALVRMPLGG